MRNDYVTTTSEKQDILFFKYHVFSDMFRLHFNAYNEPIVLAVLNASQNAVHLYKFKKEKKNQNEVGRKVSGFHW